MNAETAEKLGDMVRATKMEEGGQAILWAVQYHLALFLYGIESPEQTLQAILIACNSNRDDNMMQRCGLENVRSAKIEVEKADWRRIGMIMIEENKESK